MKKRSNIIKRKSNRKISQEVEAVEEAAVAEEVSEEAEEVTVVVIAPKLKEDIEEVDTTEVLTEIKMKSMLRRMMECTLSQSKIRSQEETKRRTWH